MFSEQDLREAEDSPVLGPAYFDARRVAERLMKDFEAELFEPLLKKASDGFYDAVRDKVETFLLSDTECNIQGEMYRMVDNCVEALLTGKQWALQRYALTDKFDGAAIREGIIQHIPEELKDKRISDLEKELKTLKEDLQWHKSRY